MLIDIHSHNSDVPSSVFCVLNVQPDKQQPYLKVGLPKPGLGLSVGIHPWHTMEWTMEEVSKLEPIFALPTVLLIGEIGLDKACKVPLDHQLQLFHAQAALADKLRKPVLLHMVRSLAEVMAVKRIYPHVPAWIIHGFRGGRQEAGQCLSNGFYLSFGQKFKIEGLRACPLQRMFAETDESRQLDTIYSAIAKEKQVTIEELEDQLYRNFHELFPAWLL
ncbi:MAG: TatD family hydrolase [Bacteroidota bacterium]|nr:TatD family hydrolase [Bacteroidota bacterium]